MEVIPMQATVALRGRGRLATHLNSLLAHAAQQPGWRAPDPRNLRTWRQFLVGVWAKRSTRLLTVAQAVAPYRHVRSVKAAALALGYLLSDAAWPLRPFSTRVLLAAVDALDPARLATYRGYVLLVIDPTEYPKRSRGTGPAGAPDAAHWAGAPAREGSAPATRNAAGPRRPVPRGATTTGYVDGWAGLVLKGKQFVPLARHLYSNRHPRLKSQNRVEEAVLGMARGLLRRLGRRAIAVGDRGLGRKDLLIRLAREDQAFVFRIDADITAWPVGGGASAPLATLLAQQPGLGQAVWERGQEEPLLCQVRSLGATIRYSRSGRQADTTEATLTFVEFVPLEPGHDSLVLATTLPAATLREATGVGRVYAQRWSVETGFEVLKGWGLGRFMVREWEAIDRVLWIVALAYTVLLLALRDGTLGGLRTQARALLRQQSVLGHHLTVGKFAEAISLDLTHHYRAWRSAWLL